MNDIDNGAGINVALGKEYLKYVNFKPANGEFKNIFNVVGKHSWSPIVYSDNYRISDNFKFSELIGLDFDDGALSLKEAIEWVKDNDFEAMIGTTKSHQVMKQLTINDRFRMIIRTSETCRDLNDYEYTLTKVIKETKADPSCKDAARFFYPCKNLELMNHGKNRANWITTPFDETREYKQAVAAKIAKKEWRDMTKIAPAIWGHIMWGCRPPGRHKLCYIIGANLGLRGFTTDEIIKLMRDNKSPLLEIGVADAARAVTNGSDRALGTKRNY
jgi:hypothetical protein